LHVGIVATLLIAVIWPTSLLLTAGNDAWRWIINHLTFGLAHHAIFPIANGTFFALLDWRVFTRHGIYFTRNALAILFVLILFVELIVVVDFLGSKREPYMLRESRPWLQKEKELRRLYRNLPANEAEYTQDIEAYKKEMYQGKRNFIAYLNAVITGAFAIPIVSFAWYLAVVLGPWNKTYKPPYGCIFFVWSLFALWRPLRSYADWYDNYFFEYPTRLETNPVLSGTTLIALLVLAILLVLAWIYVRDRAKHEQWMSRLGLQALVWLLVGLDLVLIIACSFTPATALFPILESVEPGAVNGLFAALACLIMGFALYLMARSFINDMGRQTVSISDLNQLPQLLAAAAAAHADGSKSYFESLLDRAVLPLAWKNAAKQLLTGDAGTDAILLVDWAVDRDVNPELCDRSTLASLLDAFLATATLEQASQVVAIIVGHRHYYDPRMLSQLQKSYQAPMLAREAVGPRESTGPVFEWRGPPDRELQFFLRRRDTTTVAVEDLWRAIQRSTSVCLVVLDLPDGVRTATGFLIGPDLVLTNYHVLASRDDREDIRANAPLVLKQAKSPAPASEK
jgi:hypothetical protein